MLRVAKINYFNKLSINYSRLNFLNKIIKNRGNSINLIFSNKIKTSKNYYSSSFNFIYPKNKIEIENFNNFFYSSKELSNRFSNVSVKNTKFFNLFLKNYKKKFIKNYNYKKLKDIVSNNFVNNKKKINISFFKKSKNLIFFKKLITRGKIFFKFNTKINSILL